MIFIEFASSDIAIEWDDSTVLYNVSGQVLSSADGMIAHFPNKPGDICNQIYNPFSAGPLLANPLQEIDVTDLVIQAL